MPDELTVFDYHEQPIRTIDKDGETWWVLADVCRALELSNPTVVADRLECDERAKSDLGRQGSGWIINEPGLYSVILRSDKPEAKAFKRWVTHEVLPAIRKRGSYGQPQTDPRMEVAKLLAKARSSTAVKALCSLYKIPVDESKPTRNQDTVNLWLNDRKADLWGIRVTTAYEDYRAFCTLTHREAVDKPLWLQLVQTITNFGPSGTRPDRFERR